MSKRSDPCTYAGHLLFTFALSCSLLLSAQPVDAQGGRGGRQGGQGQQFGPGRNLRGVLGGVALTAADSVVQQVVGRLDFDSYKEILRGLTQFGDREQGTERNAQAIDWIEQQLQGWGYETARIQYMYEPRGGGEP
jgi:hypothetical protein